MKLKPTKTSLNLTEKISNEIDDNTFHHHYHILYDIANTYPKDQKIVYVEIGCYAGGSACLMLQRPNTKVVSIDLGYPIPEEIVHKNVSKLNKHNNLYNYLKGDSQTHEMFIRLKEVVSDIDIFFIDGDHSYQAVINDFMLYEGLVKKGGYIVFDDYRDTGCPGTKIAVDEIIDSVKDRYTIIGTLENFLGARPNTLIYGNDFIIQKI